MSNSDELTFTDPFLERTVFPDAAAVFSFQPPDLSAVVDDCVVVLDTNVLLVPYTISPKTLDEIGRTYDRLAQAGRLVVPAQVAREFAKNRAKKLGELYQQLTDKRSTLKQLQSGRYPLLEGIAEYSAVTQLESEIDALLRRYQESLAALLRRVKQWHWDDPVSLLYSRLFTPSIVVEASITEEALLTDMKARLRAKLPPGYKDGGKDSNAAGDLVIWHTILEIAQQRKRPVLLVSGDIKPDWWHKSGGQPLYPRYELVDEFRRASGGKAFFLASLADFLSVFGVNQEVVAEVRSEEAAASVSRRATQREHVRRSLEAEEAIGRWLRLRFPTSNVEDTDERAVDYIVRHPDGSAIGVDTMYSARDQPVFPIHRLRHHAPMVEKAIASGVYDDFLLCCVAPSRDACPRFISRFRKAVMPNRPISVSIGFLESGTYCEFAHVQTLATSAVAAPET